MIFKHLVESQQFTPEIIFDLFKRADELREKPSTKLNGKFKGMLVAVNKKTCVAYKRALDDLLPKEYSEVVMSYSDKKDSSEVQKYRSELEKRFGTKDMGAINRRLKGISRKKRVQK